MSKFAINNFDIDNFLENYWQKKPLLLSEGLPDIALSLTGDELAGLSLDSEIESRLIISKNNQFTVQQGPFEPSDFSSLKNLSWSLLVQAVDQWVEEIHELKSLFDFIPAWRLDDIMISYSSKGGSVGPHFDFYDVFLIQVLGNKTWHLGQHCDESTPLLPHPALKLLEDFEPYQTHRLAPGDILYVPPGKSHHGIAETDDCMTISIGFRAPSFGEIVDQLGATLLEKLPESVRYEDENLIEQYEQNHPAEISVKNLASIKNQLINIIQDDTLIAHIFGTLMTEQRYTPESLTEYYVGETYIKCLDARIAYTHFEDKLLVFVNGNTFAASAEHLETVQLYCDQSLHTIAENEDYAVMEIFKKMLEFGAFELLENEV